MPRDESPEELREYRGTRADATQLMGLPSTGIERSPIEASVMSDRLLTPEEAALVLGTTVAVLAELRDAGDAPENYEITVHVIRYSSTSVEEYRREREGSRT